MLYPSSRDLDPRFLSDVEWSDSLCILISVIRVPLFCLFVLKDPICSAQKYAVSANLPLLNLKAIGQHCQTNAFQHVLKRQPIPRFLRSHMARRRKNRTHLKSTATSSQVQDNVPKSFIIRHGQVGSSLSQLVRDLRKVMEPNTATRLKVSTVFHGFLEPTCLTLDPPGTQTQQAKRLPNDGPCSQSISSYGNHADRRRSIPSHCSLTNWANV